MNRPDDLLFMPSRMIQVPNRVPDLVLPVMMHNNPQLAPKPQALPPAPTIAQGVVGTATGFQFTFNQVKLPTGASNTISAYKVYRNTQNLFVSATLVHTFMNDPTNTGEITFTDTITAATGASYYYWVTAVDSTGQESLPRLAQCEAVPGSAGSTPFSNTTSFAYTSTTLSITWYWDGTNGSTTLDILRADNTTTGPISGNQTITGLTANTTYNFYPYWDEVSQSVKWVAGGSGTPAYAQPSAGGRNLVQAQNLRNQIPLSLGGMQASTTASGSGSGTGGGGGGGGGCFSGNVRFKTPNGLTRFDSAPAGWFEIENLTGTHRARLITHPNWHEEMIDMGNGEFVTFGHHIKFPEDSKFAPAIELFQCSRTELFTGTVYNLEVDTEDEYSRHYVLENGVVAHNTGTPNKE